MIESKRAAPGEGDPLESNDLLAGKIKSFHTSIANETQSGLGLRAHFDRAVDLLEQKAALATDIAEARGDGLDPGVLLVAANQVLTAAGLRPAHFGKPAAVVISAELTGSNNCDCESYGISTTGHAPVLAMCRELLLAGCGPDQALEIYRAGALSLRIRSIGQAARLVVQNSENGRPHFRLARPERRGAAPPVRQNGRRAV
jgi:hypothetical protein